MSDERRAFEFGHAAPFLYVSESCPLWYAGVVEYSLSRHTMSSLWHRTREFECAPERDASASVFDVRSVSLRGWKSGCQLSIK